MAPETELKLELTGAAAEALATSPLWPAGEEVSALRSVYFDTADGRLAAAGLSLRIRRSGRKRVQTVKAEGATAAGLFVRSEWERPVRRDIPEIDDATPIPALLGDSADAIDRVFEVRVERRSVTIEEDATIELALDRGQIVAAERKTPVCELELELKAGAPAALFAFARRVDAVAPVRLGVLSKAERGRRLTAPAVAMVKAQPVVLDAGITVAEAFTRVVGGCVRHFRLNEALLLNGRTAGPLHQARVALRRLRTALTVFVPAVAGERHARLREELRWLAAVLGDARNLDVLLEGAGDGAVRDRVAAAREAAYDRVIEALDSSRVRGLMLDLAEWTAAGEWLFAPETASWRAQQARDFAARALDRLRRKVKRRGHALAGDEDEARHELRKDAKKLRYAAEFLGSLFSRKRERRRYAKFIETLEVLQDHLGALNDLATAPLVLRQLGLANEQAADPAATHERRRRLLDDAADAHDDLMDRKRFWSR